MSELRAAGQDVLQNTFESGSRLLRVCGRLLLSEDREGAKITLPKELDGYPIHSGHEFRFKTTVEELSHASFHAMALLQLPCSDHSAEFNYSPAHLHLQEGQPLPIIPTNGILSLNVQHARTELSGALIQIMHDPKIGLYYSRHEVTAPGEDQGKVITELTDVQCMAFGRLVSLLYENNIPNAL